MSRGTVKKDDIVPNNTVRIINGRLGGRWLGRLGFTFGEVLTVDASPGVITYQLHENGIERTLELVKFARKNKLRLVQVINNAGDPFIEIPRSYLKKAGLTLNEKLYAIYESGLLKLQKSDLS